MAYSDSSDEDVDLNNPNLDAALHQAEQLLGIPPDEARFCTIPCCQLIRSVTTVVGD